MSVPKVRKRKGARERLVMLTAYDFPSARFAEAAGIDILLVGDSLGMVVQGLNDTLRVTLDQTIYHTSLVSRAAKRALVVADMPFMSYHTGFDDAVRNAGRCIQEGGAQAVKIEGGLKRSDLIRHLVENEIPVMAHIGLTPQSVHALGGFKVQGKTLDTAQALVEDALSVENAGAFALVLECVPAEVAREITQRITIPTIGIGAGPHCDGQVLVFHDVLGLYDGHRPRFVRQYGEFGQAMTQALARYRNDVASGAFPSSEESFHLKEDTAKRFEDGDPKHADSQQG